MTTRKKWSLALVLLLGVSIAAVLFVAPREPTHKGRPLSDWVHDLSNDKHEVRAAAAEAIRAIGPGAVPYLTNSLAQRDAITLRIYRKNLLPKPVMKWARDRFKWHAPVMESRNAAIALSSMGSNATDAIPPLIDALNDPSPLVAQSAAIALGNIGPNAIPALRSRLTNGTPAEMPWLFFALGLMRSNAAPAAPEIATHLTNDQMTVGDRAAMTLMQIGAPSAFLATNYFNSTNLKTRLRALSVLRNIGPSVAPATNTILPLLTDTNSEIRYNALLITMIAQPPPEFATPIWLNGIKDTDPRNVELALNGLAQRGEDVITYNREIAALAARNQPGVSAIASNALTLFRAWPRPE
jgi:hypothetical protein